MPEDLAAVTGRFFDLLGRGDTDAWLALIADDCVVDTPFAPEGRPRHFEGIDEIRTRFADARARMDHLVFLDAEHHQTQDPEVCFVVNRSEGSFPDGRAYANRYCWRFTVRDGMVAAWTEWFDPQAVLRVATT